MLVITGFPFGAKLGVSAVGGGECVAIKLFIPCPATGCIVQKFSDGVNDAVSS
jgi:hypothetical protein